MLTDALLLLPLHACAIAGLWRAAYFKERRSRDPRGWPKRLPREAVDTEAPETGVLWPLRWLCERYLPSWLQRPLLICPACMATVYGPAPFLLTYGVTSATLALYLLYWPALSALSSAVARLINPEA